MGHRPVYDPDHEPFRHVVKLRLTAGQLNELDRLSRVYGVSRSFLLRQAFARGLGPLLTDLESGHRAGMSLRPRRTAGKVNPVRRGSRSTRLGGTLLVQTGGDVPVDRRSLEFPVDEEP